MLSRLRSQGREARGSVLNRTRRLAQPDNPAAWEAEGFAAYAAQDYDETESCFRKAAEGGTSDYFVYSFLGDKTLGLNPNLLQSAATADIRKTVDYYESELALNPYDDFAANSYALDTFTYLDVLILGQGARLFPDDAQLKVGLAVVALKQGKPDGALAVLRKIAADPSLECRAAAACARSILDDRQRAAAYDRLDELLHDQNFDGAVVCANELLKSTFDPGQRQNLLRMRDRAVVAEKVRRATDLARDGSWNDARSLLQEAASQSTDPGMNAKIQRLLDSLPGRPRVKEEP